MCRRLGGGLGTVQKGVEVTPGVTTGLAAHRSCSQVARVTFGKSPAPITGSSALACQKKVDFKFRKIRIKGGPGSLLSERTS